MFTNKKIIYFIAIYIFLLLININSITTVVGDERIYAESVLSLIDGKVDNNNHPLLAKTIWLFFVYLGNVVFGSSSPIFWRMGTIVMSIAGLFIFNKIAQKFFSENVSLIATIFLGLDPMFFAFSRLVQLEITATFFLLLSFYFLLKYIGKKDSGNFFLSALTLGFSLSAKMLALGVFVLVLFFLILWKITIKKLLTNLRKTFAFAAITIFGFVAGNTVFFFKDTSGVNILEYITDLVRSQTYTGFDISLYQTSPAWSWFMLPQVLSLYRLNFGESVESIIAFQNPVFFVLTLISLLFLVNMANRNIWKNKQIAIILIYFLGLYFMWFLGLHGTYYYYIVPILPFSILMSVYFLSKIVRNLEGVLKKLLFLSIVVFAFVYPLLIGLNIPNSYDMAIYKYSQYKFPDVNSLFCQNCYPRK